MREDVSGNKKRILYVEDHKAFGEMISSLLSDYEIILATSVAEALGQAGKDKFALYLLDFNLPDGNGAELCREIKTFDPETPVLFITVSPTLSEAEVEEMGAQGLLIKGKANFVECLRDQVCHLLGEQVTPA